MMQARANYLENLHVARKSYRYAALRSDRILRKEKHPASGRTSWLPVGRGELGVIPDLNLM